MILGGLRRHPFAVDAFFRWSLVLTYAFPPDVLRPMLPRGLTLDTHGDGAGESGFLAIAMVQTERLRPKGVPAVLGRDVFLSGYRIFAKLARVGRPSLRLAHSSQRCRSLVDGAPRESLHPLPLSLRARGGALGGRSIDD